MAYYYRDELLKKAPITIRLETKGKIIATDFIQSALDFSIMNTWQAGGGIMAAFRQGIAEGRQAVNNMASQVVDVVGSVTEALGKGDANQIAQKAFGDAADSLNAKFISAPSYFKKFEGTQINIPLNFSFRFLTDTEDKDINKEVWDFLDYMVGDFEAVSGGVYKQMAPNGYGLPTDIKFNETLKGSFTLHYGEYASIPNLLVDNCSFQLSQQFCTNGKFQQITANLSMSPGLMFTRESIKSILGVSS